MNSIADQILNGDRWVHVFPKDPDIDYLDDRRGQAPEIDHDRKRDVYRELVRRSVLFDITNVQEYAWRELGSADTLLELWRQLPSIAPPYELMWMEWDQSHAELMKRAAVLVASRRQGDGTWLVSFDVFIRIGVEAYGPWLRAECVTDGAGRVISDPTYSTSFFERRDDPFQADAAAMNLMSYIPAMAISLLHCKNVREGELIDLRSRQQRRLDDRQGRTRIVFKTLVVGTSMAAPTSDSAAGEPSRSKRPLHICRGHFATYSEDKPLFGKYTGTFWRPAHVRGSEQSGKVFKDYKVKV